MLGLEETQVSVEIGSKALWPALVLDHSRYLTHRRRSSRAPAHQSLLLGPWIRVPSNNQEMPCLVSFSDYIPTSGTSQESKFQGRTVVLLKNTVEYNYHTEFQSQHNWQEESQGWVCGEGNPRELFQYWKARIYTRVFYLVSMPDLFSAHILINKIHFCYYLYYQKN